MMKSLWTILVLAALLLLYPTEAFLRPAAVSSSHVTLHAQFQPSSKARTKVAIDPKTGLYRPIKQVKGRDPNSNDIGTTWDGLKEAFYKSVDSLSSLPSVVDKLSQSRKDEEDIASSAVFSGYADIERELGAAAEQPLKRKVDTPVGKILKRSTAPSSLTSQPLIPPTNLEKAKAFLWKSVDATSFTQDKQQEMEKDASVTIMSSTMESFQPAVRARLIASDEFLQAMEDLESSNPVVRLAAGRRIRKLAQQQQQQIRKGPDVFDKFKAKLYRALDSVEATGRQIAALPSKAVSAYEATADTAQRTVQAARQVPSKVQSQVQAVQQSIQDTVEATQQTVETVQRLPSDVQTSIQTTKQNVQDKVQATVDTAQRVQSTVQSVTTQSKILLGLEKPQPKPPTEPPPEPWTARQAAWKVLSISSSLAAQTAWFVGKNGAKLAWRVGSVAAEKGGKALQEQMEEYKSQQTKKSSQKAAAPPPSSSPEFTPSNSLAATGAGSKDTSSKAGAKSAPIVNPNMNLQAKAEQQAQEMSALELEIEEALRLADAAIQSAQDEITREEEKRKSDREGSQS